MLDSITTISKDGVLLSPRPNQKAVGDMTSKDMPEITTDVKSINAILDNINNHLNEDSSISSSESNIIKHLKKELATVHFVRKCETVYYSIFGSQIALLKTLNLSNTRMHGFTTDDIDQYLNGISQIFNGNVIEQAAYMSFIIDSGLVIYKDNTYIISEFGIDFLMWIQHVGLTEDKPL